jgi:hypothetical protein
MTLLLQSGSKIAVLITALLPKVQLCKNQLNVIVQTTITFVGISEIFFVLNSWLHLVRICSDLAWKRASVIPNVSPGLGVIVVVVVAAKADGDANTEELIINNARPNNTTTKAIILTSTRLPIQSLGTIT